MSDLQFIREEQAFMDSQVDLWMAQLALDPELQVPHIVLNYYFHRACDERSIQQVLDEQPRQRSVFGGRSRRSHAESDEQR